MAASSMKFSFLLILFSCSLIFLQGSLAAEIVCEELPTNICAFSISSSGKRCLLENSYKKDGKVKYECMTSEVVVDSYKKDGKVKYECRTSEVVVERLTEYIETDECVNACGVKRNTVGISSDAFFEPHFAAKLCSPHCYQNCPNIVDLYYHLAAAEGVFLPNLCDAQKRNPRRAMVELTSNGNTVAPAPFIGEEALLVANSPQIAPASF